jgi:alanyl-tRNA synthetase
VKGHCRVDFVCGGRALRDYRNVNLAAKWAARLLTVGRDDLPKKVGQLLEEGKRNRRRLRELAAVAVNVEAQELAARAETAGPMRVARGAFQGRELDELKSLARSLAERGVVALLGSVTGENASLIFAGPKEAKDLPDLQKCLHELLEEFGGRGGGARDFAQGVLESPANLDTALSRAFAWITERKD